MNRKGQFEVSK